MSRKYLHVALHLNCLGNSCLYLLQSRRSLSFRQDGISIKRSNYFETTGGIYLLQFPISILRHFAHERIIYSDTRRLACGLIHGESICGEGEANESGLS